jgi:hypothetical protein
MLTVTYKLFMLSVVMLIDIFLLFVTYKVFMLCVMLIDIFLLFVTYKLFMLSVVAPYSIPVFLFWAS